MSRRAALTFVAAAISLVLLGAAALGRRATREAAAALARVASRTDALDIAIAREKDRVAAAGRDRDRLEGLADERRARQAAVRKASNRPSRQVMLADNPQLLRLWSQAFRAGVAQRFHPLYRNLGLSGEQIGKFEEMLTRSQQAQLDLAAASWGLDRSDPAIAALQRENDATLRSEAKALLGDEGYAQLQQFERLLPLQGVVNGIAFSAALTSTPLLGAQAAELTVVLAEAQDQYRSGGPAGSDPAQVDWDAALPRARVFLSDSQFADLASLAQLARVRQLANQFDRQASPPSSP